MKIKNKFIYLMFLAFVTSTANASLIQTDLYSTGDGLLTYDSESGLEWLDISETYLLFGRQVMSRISDGGIWEGFHHASRDEVNDFWENAGVPFTGGPAPLLYDPVRNLVSLMGSINGLRGLTSTRGGSIFSGGLSGASLSTECHFDIFEGGSVCTGSAKLNSYFINDYLNTASSDGGTWLARTAIVVPIPASIWFFVSGIISCFGFSINRRTNKYRIKNCH